MFASPDVGLVWCINVKILLHIAFAIPNANILKNEYLEFQYFYSSTSEKKEKKKKIKCDKCLIASYFQM